MTLVKLYGIFFLSKKIIIKEITKHFFPSSLKITLETIFLRRGGMFLVPHNGLENLLKGTLEVQNEK